MALIKTALELDIINITEAYRADLRADTALIFTITIGDATSWSTAQLLLYRNPAYPRHINVMWRFVDGLVPPRVCLHDETAWKTSPFNVLLEDGLANALAYLERFYAVQHRGERPTPQVSFLETSQPQVLSIADCHRAQPHGEELSDFTCRLSPLRGTVRAA